MARKSSYGGGVFSIRETNYLESLPAVERVRNGRIIYTEEFKRECMRRYNAGESPSEIFREAGLDSALIGYKRIERCIARWKKTVTFDDDASGDPAETLTSVQSAVSETDSSQNVSPFIRDVSERQRPRLSLRYGGRSDATVRQYYIDDTDDLNLSLDITDESDSTDKTVSPDVQTVSPTVSPTEPAPSRNITASRTIRLTTDRDRLQRDTRDLIIAQQARRIQELEDQLEAARGVDGGNEASALRMYHDGDLAADDDGRRREAA